MSVFALILSVLGAAPLIGTIPAVLGWAMGWAARRRIGQKQIQGEEVRGESLAFIAQWSGLAFTSIWVGVVALFCLTIILAFGTPLYLVWSEVNSWRNEIRYGMGVVESFTSEMDHFRESLVKESELWRNAAQNLSTPEAIQQFSASQSAETQVEMTKQIDRLNDELEQWGERYDELGYGTMGLALSGIWSGFIEGMMDLDGSGSEDDGFERTQDDEGSWIQAKEEE